MARFDIRGRDRTPLALLTIADALARGKRARESDDYSRSASEAAAQRKLFEDETDRVYKFGQVDATREGDRLQYASAIDKANVEGRFGQVKTFLDQAASLGKQFDPGTVNRLFDFVQGGDGGPSNAGDNRPGKPMQLSDFRASPSPAGASPTSGWHPPMRSLDDAASATTAPTYSPDKVVPLFQPSDAATASTDYDTARADEARANAANKGVDTRIRSGDYDSYASFMKAVGPYLTAQQQSDATLDWNDKHPSDRYRVPGTSYPDALPSGQSGPPTFRVQPLYPMGAPQQAELDKTASETGRNTAQGRLYDAQSGQVAPDSQSRRTLQDRTGRAALTNATAATTNADAHQTQANNDTSRTTYLTAVPNADPYVAGQQARLNKLDQLIADADKRKGAAIAGYTYADNGTGMRTPIADGDVRAITAGLDAQIKGWQTEKARVQADIERRMVPPMPVNGPGVTPGSGVSPSARGNVPPGSEGPLPDYSKMTATQRAQLLKKAMAGK